MYSSIHPLKKKIIFVQNVHLITVANLWREAPPFSTPFHKEIVPHGDKEMRKLRIANDNKNHIVPGTEIKPGLQFSL